MSKIWHCKTSNADTWGPKAHCYRSSVSHKCIPNLIVSSTVQLCVSPRYSSYSRQARHDSYEDQLSPFEEQRSSGLLPTTISCDTRGRLSSQRLKSSSTVVMSILAVVSSPKEAPLKDKRRSARRPPLLSPFSRLLQTFTARVTPQSDGYGAAHLNAMSQCTLRECGRKDMIHALQNLQRHRSYRSNKEQQEATVLWLTRSERHGAQLWPASWAF